MKQLSLFGDNETYENKKVFVYRTMLVKDTSVKYNTKKVNNSEIAARVFRQTINKRGQSDREQLMVMFLTCKNEVSGVNIVHTGTINSCAASPREIMGAALTANCTSIILGHNHPSGDTSPSKEDINLTKHLILAGKVLGITVLDHVILGVTGDWMSMRDNRNLDFVAYHNEADKTLRDYTANPMIR